MKRLNLGCGFNRLPGYHNVDKIALCRPDELVDLEQFPWPWADNAFGEILAIHTLEHLGASADTWFRIVQEIWRVAAPDAAWKIAVPHPRSDNFLHDPTHVRAITPVGIAMFDQIRNIENHRQGGQETKLGLMLGVDFELVDVRHDLEEPWHSKLRAGEMTLAEADLALRHQVNVCQQIRMIARVVKPARGESWLREFERQAAAQPELR
jgi:hypothetical protein